MADAGRLGVEPVRLGLSVRSPGLQVYEGWSVSEIRAKASLPSRMRPFASVAEKNISLVANGRGSCDGTTALTFMSHFIGRFPENVSGIVSYEISLAERTKQKAET